MYTEHDAARRYRESAKLAADDHRGAFARDRARVLHSAALRRLAGKTQVVGPGEDDVPRTRLTHSLEVAQIGREIATELGADPDVVDTAGLAHDIGHPPFGHNGEEALDGVAGPCGGFEGNAQTLRILARLEPKVLGRDGESYGLNLTRACLDAATKYPWTRANGCAKYGVYDEDLRAFDWLRAGAPPRRRCLEAQIMDWADDVAYSVHDVEDAVLSGRVSLAVLADATEVAGVAAARYTGQDQAAVEAAAAELLLVPAVAELAKREYDGTLGAQITLKQLTSELVGRFTTAAVGATREVHGGGALTRYAAALVVPDAVAAEVALLKAIALRYVMSDPVRVRQQARQRNLLAELVGALNVHAETSLDAVHAARWLAAGDDGERLRVVIDQVAALTDAQAVAWHHQLT
jgi:dGTPase